MSNVYDSPSVNNLAIVTGIVYFKPDGETAYRDLGYVDDLTINMTVESKAKKIARGGLVTTAFTAFTAGSGTIKMTLAELTPANWAMFVLGTEITNTDGSKSVRMLSKLNPSGYLKFVADNTFGPQKNFDDYYVTLGPSGDFNMLNLNGDFATIPVQGTINVDPVTGLYPLDNFPLAKA